MEQPQAPPQWGPQNTQGVPVSQLRKMQLTDDDRALMNKFKAQGKENYFAINIKLRCYSTR